MGWGDQTGSQGAHVTGPQTKQEIEVLTELDYKRKKTKPSIQINIYTIKFSG